MTSLALKYPLVEVIARDMIHLIYMKERVAAGQISQLLLLNFTTDDIQGLFLFSQLAGAPARKSVQNPSQLTQIFLCSSPIYHCSTIQAGTDN